MIPKGYQIQIITWENDGDSYSTQILSGLTKEDVSFYVEMANRFTCKHDQRKKGFGNSYVPSYTLTIMIGDLLEKHPNISEQILNDWTEAYDDARKNISSADNHDDVTYGADWIYELLVDNILGQCGECYCDEPNFCRVVDKIKVFYIPEDAQDVTDQFIGD